MSNYEPTWESLDAHEVPEWFRDAKLGIFVHWGLYSVPAWAPPDADIGGEDASPYAEWYPYYMYEDGSPTREYHRETYGEDVEYIDFAEEFTAEDWDPGRWADFFADVGAGYVVLTAEHHDGYPLWDSHYASHTAATSGPERDLVGDLCEAVRERDLRFAASYHANFNYYQPGFEGQFGHPDFAAGHPFDDDAGPGPEYVDFMNAKHRELIRKYRPDLLWFDVPKAHSDHLEAKELVADYYNAAEQWGKEVAVNDRASTDSIGGPLAEDDSDDVTHGDFETPEYYTYDEIRDDPWEATRGIGHSFGYNQVEDEEDHLAPVELVRSFVDVVSKNGNLLLNVGPRADGTIPEIQRERLAALGDWLAVNGTAIFGTRPWVVSADDDGETQIRYTWRDGDLFAIALEWPGDRLELSVPAHVSLADAPDAALLTGDGDAEASATLRDDALVVSLPERPDHDHAYAVRLSGVTNPRQE
ncbi:alpha-L-fucosidase [Halosimplex salinum]|uniref:alpha-L-fucosidase n=1 Tax=Halosimplex salinum TaxID=1710538 RepID=UPI000F47164D|nr:alpha-L-fucosidase [Halosimplex salinum]